MNTQKLLFIAIVSGLLSGLAVHSEHFWVFGIIGFAGMVFAWMRSQTSRLALWIGWFAGFAYFATSLRMLLTGYHSIGMAGILPIVGVAAMYALLCIWWGPVFYLSHKFRSRTGLGGLIFLWFSAEMLRAYIAPAIPPSFLGDVWSLTPVIQVVSLIGIEGLSLITLIAAATIAKSLGNKPIPLFAIVLFAALWKMGLVREDAPQGRFTGPLVAVINTDVSQAQRWNPAIIDAYMKDLAAQSQAAWKNGADIVLWPENATPYFLEEKEYLMAAFPPEGKYLIHGSTILADMQTGESYNGMAITGQLGETITTYNKAHLFPFAEYMPFANTIQKITNFGTIATPLIATGGYRRGIQLETPIPIRIKGRDTNIIPMICYEALVPSRVNYDTDTPAWFLNMANDAWWVGSSGGNYISAASRVRAIERDLPMIRVSNLGPSWMIDGMGRTIHPDRSGFYRLP